MINHKHKFLYTHYPKCAGTCVRKYLIENYRDGVDEEIEKIQYRHCSLKKTLDRLNFLGIDQREYYKFSFCRNPWELCVSYYFFMSHKMPKHLESKNKPQNKITNFCMNNSFEDFVYSDFCFSSFDNIYMYEGDFLIDFVIRQEHLQEDFNQLCKHIDTNAIKLSYINTTNHLPYVEYYNTKTRSVIEDKFHKEIEKFKYKYK